MTKPQSVLVVEDDPGVHGLLKTLAERHCPTVDVVLSAISRYFGDRFPPGTLVLQKPFEIDEIESILRGE